MLLSTHLLTCVRSSYAQRWNDNIASCVILFAMHILLLATQFFKNFNQVYLNKNCLMFLFIFVIKFFCVREPGGCCFQKKKVFLYHTITLLRFIINIKLASVPPNLEEIGIFYLFEVSVTTLTDI